MTSSLSSDIWQAANIMRSDDGTSGIYEYIEQISWMFFLKVFEDLENRYEAEYKIQAKEYERIIPSKYSWSTWTNRKWKGEEILEFIDNKLFPFLGSLINKEAPECKTIGVIFSQIKHNKMKSAYNLRDVIDVINEINFNNPEDSHILSQFYEDLLIKLGKESGVAGEFYTPRPVVRLMVRMVDPKLKLTNSPIKILDPFCGSCGFLIEAYKRMVQDKMVTTKSYRELQRNVFHGAEKKSLPYLVGTMNCILHGLLTPNVLKNNSLNENITNFSPDDKFDYVFTNPPFGGKEGEHIQENFPVKIKKTELLALQLVMRRLKEGGKCAIVVPEPVLWRSGKYLTVRRDLLENFNVHTIISLPAGVFANVTPSGLGPKTDLVFFEKKGKTQEIWYYELTPPNNKLYSRVNVIKDEDLEDCFNKWEKREISSNSWITTIDEIERQGYDLTSDNPNITLGFNTENPRNIITKVIRNQKQIPNYLTKIDDIMSNTNRDKNIFKNWDSVSLDKCLLPAGGLQTGFACSKRNFVKNGIPHLRPYNIGIDGKLDLSHVEYLPENMVDTKIYSLKKGDIIFNNTNSKELVGKSAMVEKDIVCGFSNHLTRLRVNKSVLEPEWLLQILKLHWMSGLFLKKSRKWIGQAGINPESLLKIEITKPNPAIQREILDEISKTRDEMESIKKLSKEIEDYMEILAPSIFKYLLLNKI